MATQNTQTMSPSAKSPSSSAGAKIYPVTLEMMEAEEDMISEMLERRLQKIKQQAEQTQEQ